MNKNNGNHLATESVESASLPLQCIHNIHGSDSLSLGMISVGDGVTNDRLEEHTEDGAGLLIDQVADTLDTTTTSKTANSWLSDALNVITKQLAMTLSSSLSQSLSSFSATSHC